MYPIGHFTPIFGPKQFHCVSWDLRRKIFESSVRNLKILSIKKRLFMGKLAFLPSFLPKTTKSDQYWADILESVYEDKVP